MTRIRRNQFVLVVSQTPDLADMARKAMDSVVDVDLALSRKEALDKIKTTRPDIIQTH